MALGRETLSAWERCPSPPNRACAGWPQAGPFPPSAQELQGWTFQQSRPEHQAASAAEAELNCPDDDDDADDDDEFGPTTWHVGILVL